jgi:hypothetical protein
MAQQTAIEWLQDQYDNCPESFLTDDDFKKAKEMEREQCIKNYNVGYTDAQCNHINDAENYSNEQDYINNK